MAALAAIIAIQIQDLKKANVEARRRKVRTNKFLLFEDRLSINKTDVSGSQDYVNPSLLQVEVENASEGSCHRRAVAPLRSQQIRSRDRLFPRRTLPQALRMFLDS
jgi:hypothetical protein